MSAYRRYVFNRAGLGEFALAGREVTAWQPKAGRRRGIEAGQADMAEAWPGRGSTPSARSPEKAWRWRVAVRGNPCSKASD